MFVFSSNSVSGTVNVTPPIKIIEIVASSLLNITFSTFKYLTGSSSSLILKPLPSDDPKRRKPDISLAKSKLNWEPKVSLNTGINNTIKFFKNI